MSDTKPTNPKDAAATTRLDLSLFPMSATAYGALAMTEGHLKYGGYNYRYAGVCVSVYVAALLRHVAKFYNGEWADPKTKVPHLANALACIAVLIDGFEQGNINDDRPPVQTASIYGRAQEIVAHLQKLFPNGPARFRRKAAPITATEITEALVRWDQIPPEEPGDDIGNRKPAPLLSREGIAAHGCYEGGDDARGNR